MTDLVDAYQRREVHTAEKIIRGEYLSSVGFNAFSQDRQTIGRPSWETLSSNLTLGTFFGVYELRTSSILSGLIQGSNCRS